MTIPEDSGKENSTISPSIERIGKKEYQTHNLLIVP